MFFRCRTGKYKTTTKFWWQNIYSNLHIIHITGVRHLLNVDACGLLHTREYAAYGPLHQILDVHKTAPNVAHVTEGVSSWTGIPKPSEKDKKKNDTRQMYLMIIKNRKNT